MFIVGQVGYVVLVGIVGFGYVEMQVQCVGGLGDKVLYVFEGNGGQVDGYGVILEVWEYYKELLL